MIGKNDGTGSELLPVVEIDGNEYVIDVANREICMFGDPTRIIDMHTEEARQLIAAMDGTVWNCHTWRDVLEKRRAAV